LLDGCTTEGASSDQAGDTIMATLAVSDATFADALKNATVPVVVDFWAEWCGPCKAIGPALEEIATELDGAVTIMKVNIDENPKIADQFHIRAIPTLMMFKNGEVSATQTGALPKSKLADWIKKSAA
jgi:thioredoxin 1